MFLLNEFMYPKCKPGAGRSQKRVLRVGEKKKKKEEGVGAPETGFMDGYKPSCEYWEPNPDPPQEQQVKNHAAISPAIIV